MSEERSVARAAGVVASATLLSRVFGYLRDMVVAALFGAGASADAFWIAFTIPNLLRRFFGEGTLTAAFIPVFTDYRENRGEQAAKELAHIAFTLLAIVLAVVTLLGILVAPWIVTLLASGFRENAEKFDLAVRLTRFMFPYALFVCLVALSMGVLNTLRHFFAPAFSPVILNLSMIAAAVGLRAFFEPPITALAVGVLVAGVLQLAFQLPFMKQKGYMPRPAFNFRHSAIKRISLLMLPAIFGMAVYNLNVLVSKHLASLLGDGPVSWMYYADRLMELPLGVFAIALGTAVLPSMSRLAATGRHAEIKATLTFSLRMVFFIVVPASAGLIALRVPIVNVLFQRGQFDYQSTLGTAFALQYYCYGLWAFSTARIVVPTFYAMEDFRTPVKVSVLALFANVIAGICLIGPVDVNTIPAVTVLAEKLNVVGPMRQGGLALATSLASMIQVAVLFAILRRRLGRFGLRRVAVCVVKSVLGAVAMAIVTGIVADQFADQWRTSGASALKVAGLAAAIGAGTAVYLAVSFLLRSEELTYLSEILSKRLRRRRSGS